MAGAAFSTADGRGVFVVDGHPVHFFMRPCKERQDLRSIVEGNGGLLSGNRNAADIELYTVGDVCSNRDALPSLYVHECVKAGRLLDAETFRKTHRTPNNPNGEDDSDGRISDIEDEPARAANSEAHYRQTKRKYLLSEDLAIIDFVVAHCHRYPVSGSTLWKKMQLLQITPHSWQSMKQRFKMQIVPCIYGYDVPQHVQKKIADLFTVKSTAFSSAISKGPAAMARNHRRIESGRAQKGGGGVMQKPAGSQAAVELVRQAPASNRGVTLTISEQTAERRVPISSASSLGSKGRSFRPAHRIQYDSADAGSISPLRPAAAPQDHLPASETDGLATSTEHATSVASLVIECEGTADAGRQNRAACVHGIARVNRKRMAPTIAPSKDRTSSSTSSEDEFDRVLIAASSREATGAALICGTATDHGRSRVSFNGEPLADHRSSSKVDFVEQSQESSIRDDQCQVVHDSSFIQSSQESDVTDTSRQIEPGDPPVHDSREAHTVDDAAQALPLAEADSKDSRTPPAEKAVEELIELIAGDLKCSTLSVVRTLYACNCDFKAAVAHLRSGSKGMFSYQDDDNIRMGRYDLLKGKHSKQNLIKRMEFLYRWDTS